MHYVRIDTSDGGTRRIDLPQVSRLTSVNDSGTDRELLVVVFADGGSDSTPKLYATDERDRAAITVLKSNLDALAGEACTT